MGAGTLAARVASPSNPSESESPAVVSEPPSPVAAAAKAAKAANGAAETVFCVCHKEKKMQEP